MLVSKTVNEDQLSIEWHWWIYKANIAQHPLNFSSNWVATALISWNLQSENLHKLTKCETRFKRKLASYLDVALNSSILRNFEPLLFQYNWTCQRRSTCVIFHLFSGLRFYQYSNVTPFNCEFKSFSFNFPKKKLPFDGFFPSRDTKINVDNESTMKEKKERKKNLAQFLVDDVFL